jgi:hypothetical protein
VETCAAYNRDSDGAGIVTLPYPADDGLLNRLVT